MRLVADLVTAQVPLDPYGDSPTRSSNLTLLSLIKGEAVSSESG
jgi:hypothetical protein